MSLEKIDLTETKETLLITLYSRALDSRRKHSILHDTKADELIKNIDYDFRAMGIGTYDATAIAIRARHFDDWTRDFIARHPTCTVVQLACGLDSRVTRIKPPATVQWFDVDFPDVIALRTRFFSETENYRLIGASVNDPTWSEKVPTDLPTLVIAEGLFMYLHESDVRTLLNRITARFKKGEICFDAMSQLAGRVAKYKRAFRSTGAVFRWTIDTPKSIVKMSSRLMLVDEANPIDSPYLAEAPWRYRAACAVMRSFPKLRKTLVLLRYRF